MAGGSLPFFWSEAMKGEYIKDMMRSREDPRRRRGAGAGQDAAPQDMAQSPSACDRAKAAAASSEPQLRCDRCEYTSGRKANLTRHMRKHTRERPYRYTLCPRHDIVSRLRLLVLQTNLLPSFFLAQLHVAWL